MRLVTAQAITYGIHNDTERVEWSAIQNLITPSVSKRRARLNDLSLERGTIVKAKTILSASLRADIALKRINQLIGLQDSVSV